MLENLSIRNKLFLIVLGLSVPALILVGALGYLSGRAAVELTTFHHLTSVRSSKANQLASYFHQLRIETAAIAQSRIVVEALREFSPAYDDLRQTPIGRDPQSALTAYYTDTFLPTLNVYSDETTALDTVLPTSKAAQYLQYFYIADNPHPLGEKGGLGSARDGSTYSDVHRRLHLEIQALADRFGFYDLLLVNTSGDVVYSVSKEADFATNLRDGPYRSSNLAAVFSAALDAPSGDDPQLVDFTMYRPSFNAPAAFVATPVEGEGRRIGVLVVQIPAAEIDHVMTGGRTWRADGLGETGETYLVGSDFLMRSNSRFFFEDPAGFLSAQRSAGALAVDIKRIEDFDTTILLQKVRTEAAEAALSGTTDTRVSIDYRGVPVLTSYAPLPIEGLRWAVLSEIDADEALAPIRRFTRNLALSLGGIALLVLPLSWLLARRFVAPIVALESAAQRFADGDQQVEVPTRSGDELGRLSRSFNQMVVAIRRQTEALIRNSEELESIRSVIVRWDPSGEILFVNPYGRELFGFEEGDLAGRSVVGTIVSDSERSQQYLRQLIEGIVDDPASYENEEGESFRENGESIRMAWRNKPVLDDDGELREILTIGIDITERHRIEQQIKEQKDLLEDTLESLTHPFYVIDVNDYSIEVANSAARRLGISGASTCHALTHDSPHPCDSREDPCPLEEIKRTGEPVAVEHIHRDAEGNRRFVEVHGYPIFDSEGTLVKMIEYSLDITDRKAMELDLAAARDAAEAANRAKSAFLANMSHELRTPMNAIIGYSEMLAEDAEEEGHQEMVPDLKKVTSAGKHLLALINDILDLSKIEAGRMDLYLERFSLRQMLEEALATVAPLVAKNHNQLVVSFGDDLGEIRADLTKLRQTLFNLLSNAAKFTENGTITLTATREQRQGADWITIQVSDTGIGIAEDKLPQVFEEFSQADGSTTRDYGGTGLGLSISQRFCRMMGGVLSVASELGEGSTFTIQLPAAVDALEAAKAVTGSEERRSDAIPEGVHPILVIDDDADSRDLLQRAFEADGFVVVTAASGEEGLDLARRLRPAFITLDVMMPGMDGWAVLKEVKADPALSQIPVAMISIVGEEDIGYSLGAVEHLIKPVDRDKLRELANLYAQPSGGGHALVVDDDETIRTLFRRALEGDRWTVVEAENGAAALQRVSDRKPDLILLDLMMPIMDGFEFLVELRKVDDAAAIPVIVVTAKDLTEEDQRCLSGGVARIVQKGALTRQELLAQVRSLVARHCAPEGDAASTALSLAALCSSSAAHGTPAWASSSRVTTPFSTWPGTRLFSNQGLGWWKSAKIHGEIPATYSFSWAISQYLRYSSTW